MPNQTPEQREQLWMDTVTGVGAAHPRLTDWIERQDDENEAVRQATAMASQAFSILQKELGINEACECLEAMAEFGRAAHEALTLKGFDPTAGLEQVRRQGGRVS